MSRKYLKLYKFWLANFLLPDVPKIINYYLYKLTEFRLLKPPNHIDFKYIDEDGIVFKTNDFTNNLNFQKYVIVWNQDKISKIFLLYNQGNLYIRVKVDLKESEVDKIIIEGDCKRIKDWTISDSIQIKL
jgi:hypothetical protein